MEKRTVIVTGIGGNVGQGIIRNIRFSKYPVKIIGTNITALSAGNHLVDGFYKVPYGYEEGFIPIIIEIVKHEKIDLIIPSTDYEAFFLSYNSKLIPCRIASGGINSTKIYLDKYLTAKFHKENNIAFVSSCLPSDFSGQFHPAIAKPRKGSGSKGILKNYDSKIVLNDDEYIVQKMHNGIEITTAVYVSYLTGDLLGIITMERSLQNGATIYCKVTRKYDKELNMIAQQITRRTDILGSFNIQSIVTPQGEICPFEINCRISGTNSIRSHFGFKDVQYTIDELLYGKKLSRIIIKEGIAFRYLVDVIYPLESESGTNPDNFIIF
jgi:carbamoyl-phosphate synthase large subunit